MKLKRLTIHDPGHSSLGSGKGVLTIYGGAVGGGGTDVVGCLLELSQHTDPFEHVVGVDINTEGLLQKAAIMLSKQDPGHRGILGAAGVGGGGGGLVAPLNVLSAKDKI